MALDSRTLTFMGKGQSKPRSIPSARQLWTAKVLKLPTLVSQEVGYDCGKKIKGRKRHILVDTLGLLIVVVITAASVSEQAGAKLVFSKLDSVRVSEAPLKEARFCRLITIWVDGGYRGQNFQHWVIDVYRWILNVVTPREEQKGFVVLPKRWLALKDIG
ncbi:transposase [Nostoc sp. CHAB 5714]|uniref:Transposase n=2 Tax=Nostoc TaxID=1177 RepID=A0ABS8IDD1_9NOSO|nr:transposase [Nostoc favosum CHAB5714]